MQTYQKINTLWMRGERGKILEGQFSQPEFEYLARNEWTWTEKVDGTNARIGWSLADPAGVHLVGGRTNDAQLPPPLLKRLVDLQANLPWDKVFAMDDEDAQVVLFGEGYGAGIQKAGKGYIPDGVDFVLFDVKVGRWWLSRPNVEDVAAKLGLAVVPVVFTGTVYAAEDFVSERQQVSQWAGVDHPEGLVGRPSVDLFSQNGDRIVTKIKVKDYRR